MEKLLVNNEYVNQRLDKALTTILDGKSRSYIAKMIEENKNGSAIITGYRGECALLTVPKALDGYPVIAIGERAFEGATFSAVILPEGISSIGWFAFYACENLINVTLPESVSSIGYAVFDGCGDLTVYCNADSYAARYAQSYGLTLITT